MSQQKADANCNKEISFSSRFTASLGWFGLFWFSFQIHQICGKHWPALSGERCSIVICCKGAVQSSRMFSSLTSADWHHLQSSHKIGTTAFSRQKLILTDALRRGLISHLLPCYLSWQSSGHICAHSCILEILRVTAHFRPPLCLSVRLNAKNK